MKKRFRKLSALMIAAVMTLGMSTSVFAANSSRDSATETDDTTLVMKKEVVYFNPGDSATINVPVVTYSYAVTPATVNEGITVTDSESHVAVVNSGITDGVTMSDASAKIPADATGTTDITASSTGSIYSDTFSIEVDLSKFDHAGIYRYAISETKPENLANLGYEYATAGSSTRYLDVYISNATTGDDLVVQGYTLFFDEGDGADTVIDNSTTGTGETAKTEGFVHEVSGTDYTDDEYVDKYKTYNVEITKDIVGALADKTNQFPFYAKVSGGPSASTVTIYSVLTGTNGTKKNDITLSAGSNTTETNIADLADDAVVTLVGVPEKSTVTLYAKNNTVDTYKVTTDGLSTDLTDKSFVPDASNEATTNTVTSEEIEKIEVQFENKLDSPSPTGVILRFAPYIIMILLAGAMLIISSKKRRVQK